MCVTVKYAETSQGDFAYTTGSNYILDGNFSRGKHLIPFLSAINGTISIQTSGGYYDVNCLKFTATAADAYTIPYDGRTAVLASAAPNEKWTFSVSAKGAVGSESIDLFIFPLTSTWAYLTPISANKTITNSWARYSVTATMPANTTGIAVRLDVNTSGDTVYFDGAMLEKSDSHDGVYNQSSIVNLNLALTPGDLLLANDIYDGFEGVTHASLYKTTGGTWEIMSTIYKTGDRSIRGKSQAFSGGGHLWDSRYYDKSYSPPIYAEVYMYYPDATLYFNQGISFGLQADQSFYFVRYDSVNKLFNLEKLVNGTQTTLKSVNTTTSLTGWLKMAVWWGTNGSITAKLYDSSGTLQATATTTDTTFTSGKVGLVVAQGYNDHADARWDDFFIRSVSSGTRESKLMLLNAVGTVKNSSIQWSATANSQTIKLETCVSTDNGSTWSSWSECTNGSAIPGLTDGLDVSSGRIRCKQTLSTTDMGITPVLHSIDISVSPLPHSKSVSVDSSFSKAISGSLYLAKSPTINIQKTLLFSLSEAKQVTINSLPAELIRSDLKSAAQSIINSAISNRLIVADVSTSAQVIINSLIDSCNIDALIKAIAYSILSTDTFIPGITVSRDSHLTLHHAISKTILGAWRKIPYGTTEWDKIITPPSPWSKTSKPSTLWNKETIPPTEWTEELEPNGGWN